MNTTKKLTIGMCVYDDFDGVYFSIQSLRMHHNISHDTEIIVIDNNPDSVYGKETKNFITSLNYRYIPYSDKNSTSVRDQIFQQASGQYTLCMDCHVLLVSDFFKYLFQYYDKVGDHCHDIVSGPLLYDSLSYYSTHFDPVWRNHMYGIWGFDQNNFNKNEPFEIPMMGLGVFSCETSRWPGFNPAFRGFGGEEGYIHEKFRRNGGKAICIPQCQWVHRFGRPGGVKYPLKIEDRIWNYFIGWLEITKDPSNQIIQDIHDHFTTSTNNFQLVDNIFIQAKNHYNL